jgi:O-antigen/teichoic acid export membrane protein
MPVGLLSTGIGTLMMPTVSRWTNDHAAAKILKRLALFASGLAAAAACYLVVMWVARDWIFGNLLKKAFQQRDLLLLVWSSVALVTVFRDQLLYFLIARARFRTASTITFFSAVISFAVSFVAMRSVGVIGALLGLLAGEVVNVAGIILFSLFEARQSPKPPESVP